MNSPLMAVLLTLAALAGMPEGGAALSDLAWMAGRWSGTDGAIRMEEVWTLPDGGLMLGLHRDVKGNRVVQFEFLRVEQTDEGIFYIASPGGKPGTPFRLVETGDRRAVFVNPDHDFPQKIVYRLDDGGVLVARIEGEMKGATKSREWRWRRDE